MTSIACLAIASALITAQESPTVPHAVAPRTVPPPRARPPVFTRRVYPTDGERQDAAAADVDGDGVDDVILGDSGLGRAHHGVQVWLGGAHRRLRGPIVSSSDLGFYSGEYVNSLEPADVNRDGRVDLVSVGGTAEGDGSADPRAWVGDGRGRFRSTFAPVSSRDYSIDVSTLDFDADGRPDIAFWFDDNDQPIGFLRGAGDGTFTRAKVATHSYLMPQNPAMVAADVNGDGHVDLVLGGTGDPVVALEYTRPSTFDLVALRGEGEPIGAGDLDSDGRDEVFAMDDRSRLTVVQDDAPAKLLPGVTVEEDSLNRHRVRVGDVTGDGRPDLVATSGRYVTVSSGLGAPIRLRGPGEIWSIALGDFNGDGRTDIAGIGHDLSVFTKR